MPLYIGISQLYEHVYLYSKRSLLLNESADCSCAGGYAGDYFKKGGRGRGERVDTAGVAVRTQLVDLQAFAALYLLLAVVCRKPVAKKK